MRDYEEIASVDRSDVLAASRKRKGTRPRAVSPGVEVGLPAAAAEKGSVPPPEFLPRLELPTSYVEGKAFGLARKAEAMAAKEAGDSPAAAEPEQVRPAGRSRRG